MKHQSAGDPGLSLGWVSLAWCLGGNVPISGLSQQSCPRLNNLVSRRVGAIAFWRSPGSLSMGFWSIDASDNVPFSHKLGQ